MHRKALEEMTEKIRKESSHLFWLCDGATYASENFFQIQEQHFQKLWEHIKLRVALSRREVLEQQDQFMMTR